MFKFFEKGNKKAKVSYYTIHHLLDAQQFSTGKEVRIGIVDWLFGKTSEYAGSFDATGQGFIDNKEHGFAMANTLWEIAPNCELFAINGITKECLNNDRLRVDYLRKAVDYAIEHNVKLLTYSHMGLKDEKAIEALKQTIELAARNGVITIFLHCNYKGNIMPVALDYTQQNAQADVFNVYQYDYNFLNPVAYEKWVENKDTSLFLSWSSMVVVLAGFIALLLEINPNLKREEIIKILENSCDANSKFKIPNISQAVKVLKNLQQ